MERELAVHVELDGTALAGRLWMRARGAKQTASFEYTSEWLRHPARFALDPALPLGRGLFHTDRAVFAGLGDSAPDRWGQTLMRRNERARATREGRQPRTLLDVDFLTLVDDHTRLGALRFTEPARHGAGFLSSTGTRVPPLIELPRLLSATSRITEDRETDEDLQLVLAPGTSLGGARPKASVRDGDGGLLIAKFPRKDDEWPLTRWEGTTLALAAAAGVVVPAWRLEVVAKKAVLLVARFDREGPARVPFLSAYAALGGAETEERSYVDLAEHLRREGIAVQKDLRQLWRRLVFNVLVSNTDDHLRNHAFLRAQGGWRLSPAYDVNPMPVDVRPRIHALALDETGATPSIDGAIAVAPSFGITKLAEANAIAREVGLVVSTWREVAAKHGLTKPNIERMESAFEHDDLRRALAST